MAIGKGLAFVLDVQSRCRILGDPEVFRKLTLDGLLVFVPEDGYRAVTAVLVCVALWRLSTISNPTKIGSSF